MPKGSQLQALRARQCPRPIAPAPMLWTVCIVLAGVLSFAFMGCSTENAIPSPLPAATKVSELVVTRTVVAESTADVPKVVTVAPEIASRFAQPDDDASATPAPGNEHKELPEPEAYETSEPVEPSEPASTRRKT